MSDKKIGSLVEFVDYNFTGLEWSELKEFLSSKKVPYSSYIKIGDDGEDYGDELIFAVEDVENIVDVWNSLSLKGDPTHLDYVIMYCED